MTNQYTHREEMDVILEELKKETNANPMTVIHDFMMDEKTNDDDTKGLMDAWSKLNDLEEAVVVKNYALWYQKTFRDVDLFGRPRR